jgi:hypothetical protein
MRRVTVRRFLTIGLSLSLMLSLSMVGRLLAQDQKKETPKAEATKESPKDDSKKDAAKTDEPKKDETKKDETKGAEAAPTPAPAAASAPAAEPLPSIPPEVEAKLEAARRAVAEAIVAAQDAGLVQTTIDPPPILDILITGRALDARTLRDAVGKAEKQVGVTPEVFGAWFTGYGKMEGVNAEKSVRVVQPSKGLKEWYDKRAEIFHSHIEAVRKAKAPATPKPAEPKPDAPKNEPPKADAPKADAPKADAPKADAPKEASKDQPK